MSDHDTIARRYIDSWNERDGARRRELIDQLYTPDAVYTDPNVALVGCEQIDEYVAAVQARYPGWVLTLGSAVDGHHGQARFNWHGAEPGAAEPAYIGFDVIATEGDRVRQVLGFMDLTPHR